MNFYGHGFGMFGMMSVIFPLFFLVVIGVIVVVVVKNIATWSHNNKQPVVPAPVVVVDKRADVHSHHHQTAHTHTTYYVTFAFENGHRLELAVPFQEYGYMTQGDRGILTFQGTRFIDFDRQG